MTTDTLAHHEQIFEALQMMNPDDDDHWTTEGAPRVEVVQALLQDNTVTRKIITEAAPDFKRSSLAAAPPEDTPGEQPPDNANPDDETPEANVMTEELVGHGFFEGSFWLNMEAGDNEVMGMDPNIVWNNHELAERGLQEFNRQIQTLVQRQDSIKKKLDELGQRSAQLSGRIDRIAPKNTQSGIRIYIQRQNEARAMRRQRALDFVKSHTNPADVKNLLEHRSPIDIALNARRPGFATQRPTFGQSQ